jgi:hypothetical protein
LLIDFEHNYYFADENEMAKVGNAMQKILQTERINGIEIEITNLVDSGTTTQYNVATVHRDNSIYTSWYDIYFYTHAYDQFAPN